MKAIVHRSVGVMLLFVGSYALYSSVMYVLGGLTDGCPSRMPLSEKWFSRLALGVVSLGLWYAGNNFEGERKDVP